MTAPAPACLLTGVTPGELLRGAARRLTLKTASATLAIAVALQADFMVELGSTTALEVHRSSAIITFLMTCCIMIATLMADEAVSRGTKRLQAYGWAVLIGSAIAALAQAQVHDWLHWPTYTGRSGDWLAHLAQITSVFLDYLFWGALVVVVYVNRRTALMSSARMNVAQLERAQAQRRIVESKLQTLRAQVAPQFLFNTLLRVGHLYDTDPDRGGQTLDHLIVYLHAALPQVRDTSTTLAQEMTLATAYLSISQAQHPDGRIAFSIDVKQADHGARMPAMVLLPLIEHLLNEGAAMSADNAIRSIEIAACVRGEMLQLEVFHRSISPIAPDTGDVLHDIRERLSLLYGDRGTLRLESLSHCLTRIVLEIPYDTNDGNHR